jgi:hypothetical protein
MDPSNNRNIKRGMSLLLEEAMKAQEREQELMGVLDEIGQIIAKAIGKTKALKARRVEIVETDEPTKPQVRRPGRPKGSKTKSGQGFRQRATPVTDAEKDEMAKLYAETNISGTEIAKKFHVSSAYVYLVAKTRGLMPRPNPAMSRPPDEERKQEILQFIKDHPALTRAEVANHFNLSTSTITKYAKAAGLHKDNGGNALWETDNGGNRTAIAGTD